MAPAHQHQPLVLPFSASAKTILFRSAVQDAFSSKNLPSPHTLLTLISRIAPHLDSIRAFEAHVEACINWIISAVNPKATGHLVREDWIQKLGQKNIYRIRISKALLQLAHTPNFSYSDVAYSNQAASLHAQLGHCFVDVHHHSAITRADLLGQTMGILAGRMPSTFSHLTTPPPHHYPSRRRLPPCHSSTTANDNPSLSPPTSNPAPPTQTLVMPFQHPYASSTSSPSSTSLARTSDLGFQQWRTSSNSDNGLSFSTFEARTSDLGFQQSRTPTNSDAALSLSTFEARASDLGFQQSRTPTNSNAALSLSTFGSSAAPSSARTSDLGFQQWRTPTSSDAALSFSTFESGTPSVSSYDDTRTHQRECYQHILARLKELLNKRASGAPFPSTFYDFLEWNQGALEFHAEKDYVEFLQGLQAREG
ncbi:hypothetical protein AC578_5890 [Pseudocercospora eumusae]|uniref:Uncharacterized protein n=1 Tax=Pseudocercospora eumusae TaxID=321146 RepID=A0A139HBE2_9PEZI|nr:hypothetical protein AC578_5890 [Pseudocercospora eumusae]